MKKNSTQYRKITTLQHGHMHEVLKMARPIIDVPLHLADMIELDYGQQIEMFESPLIGDNYAKSITEGSRFIPIDSFLSDRAFVVASKQSQTLKDIAVSSKFLKAGPRKDIFFDTDEVKVCILTCGGLCPGLNVVIREIVMSLWFNYEVRDIYGIKWGFKGVYTDIKNNWMELNPSVVSNIHKKGGTILGSSRGGFDGEKILDSLIE
jgi:6-phosphofructokinase 1